MNNLFSRFRENLSSSDEERLLKEKLIEYVNELNKDKINNLLIIPPDYTRKHSQSGKIAAFIYNKLKDDMDIKILPATGTHKKITSKEKKDMFGREINEDVFLYHYWQKDTVSIGKISSDYLTKISGGLMDSEINVEINKELLKEKYDLIISIGQVLPHGVVGMANYTKNIVVGCGGKDIINKSHYLGALYGIENLIGKDHSPVRKLYDYIENNFLDELPIHYILTVNESSISHNTGLSKLVGLFIGENREVFGNAVSLSQETNITYIDKPVNKFIVYLDPSEFTSMWLCNKAIYRTRVAIEDGGELIVIAPGLKMIGENEVFDKIIKKYGYLNKNKIINLVKRNKDLRNNLAVPAHLIHGSTENRFKVTYVSDKISKDTITEVGYNYLSLDEADEKYNFNELTSGWNQIEGEKVYFVENPATGLWVKNDYI